MSLPAAVAFGIALSWSWVWVTYSRRLLTEVTACALLLGVLGLVRGVASSHRRALLLGATLWLAWLTRPNLPVLLPAVLLAVALDTGLRGALRARPLWTLVASFAALQQLTSHAYAALSGFAPYSHYGLAFVLLDPQQLSAYRSEPVELLGFLRSHAGEIASLLSANLTRLFRSMFLRSAYLHVGWLALPAVAWALVRRGDGSLERRTAALAALLFMAVAWLVWGAFDPVRSPFLAVACLWLTICAGLDDLARGLARRLRGRAHWGPALRALPLLFVLALWAPENAPSWSSATRAQWTRYRQRGTELTMVSSRKLDEPVKRLCAALEPDALVAAVDPWAFLLWCGNAGLALPPDLDSVAQVDRYLAERAPAYVVIDRRPELYSFVASSRLRRVERAGPLTLYEVIDPPPQSRPWRAPRPLAAVGD